MLEEDEKPDDEAEDVKEPVAVAITEGTGDEVPAEETRGSKLQALLTEKLPDCISKAKADEFCVSFCYLNSKGARRQLVEALARIPRSRTELTSTYARIVASLSRLYPDILTPVLDQLRKEFYGIMKTRKQLNVENKIRNVRYQSELVKFRVAPPIVAFRMIKALLAEFSPHNVQLLTALMETCGRFLYLVPYTQQSMDGFLETMLRLRRARNLDLHHQTLIESAYFAVKPPERKCGKVKKEFTQAQQYARWLISQRLDDPAVNVDNVLKSLRRLPWLTPEEKIGEHVMKAALKVARTKYVLIPNVADCISGLMKFYPNLIVQMVDHIFEELQRALDSPYKREMQRILGITRMLGEMYNFTAITSNVIFDLLYHLINFGHDAPADGIVDASAVPVKKYDPRVPFEADSPGDLFRAQVVCEMLNTVGAYFVRGQAKDRMNRFLAYFQRYLLIKQFVPMHVEFQILDTFDYLEEQARSVAVDIARSQQKARMTSAQEAVITSQVMFDRFDNLDAAQKAVDAMELSGVKEGPEDEDEEKEGDADIDEAPHRRGEVGERGDGAAAEDNEDEEEGEESDESDDDDDDESAEGEESSDEDISEREAAKMLEKLRIAEEDDEFEKAFKSVMQDSVTSVTNRYQDVNRMVIPGMQPQMRFLNKI